MGNIHSYLLHENEIIRQPRFGKTRVRTNEMIRFPCQKPIGIIHYKFTREAYIKKYSKKATTIK